MSAPWCFNSSTLFPSQLFEFQTHHKISYLDLEYYWDRYTYLFMEHDSKYSHHVRTAIIQINIMLVELGLLIKGVPYKVNGTITEVTKKLASFSAIGRFIHHNNPREPNQGR